MPTTRWLEKLQHRLRALFFRSDADYELNDELRFHIDQKTQLYIDRGLSRAEARTGRARGQHRSALSV